MRSSLLIVFASIVSGAVIVNGSTSGAVRPAAGDGALARTDLQVSGATASTTWQCGPQAVTFTVVGTAADLTIDNKSLAMRPVVVASGSKYEALSDSTTTIWEHGGTATLVVQGREYPACTRTGAPDPFRATGNEPGWRLDIADGNMTLLTDLGQTRTVVPAPAPRVSGNTRQYVASSNGRTVAVSVVEEVCVDTMSGMPHPYTVAVVFNEQKLNGCGGEPASLLQGEWVVGSIGGTSVIADSTVTLSFEDGRVSGNSSCNRFMAGYALTGESLTITQPAGTMMACAPATLMEQEATFLILLPQVTKFSIHGGQLTLTAGDGRTISARRPPVPLQDTEWRIETINGQPVVEGSKATLRFGADGRLSGNSSCNNLMGGFTVDGQTLSIPQPAGTMMFCEPAAVMKQEAALLAALPQVRQYSIEGDLLTLGTADGGRITARRQ